MVDNLQQNVISYMKAEGVTTSAITLDLKSLGVKVDTFINAFPDGDVDAHRLEHKEWINKRAKSAAFWEKMKFTFWALILVSATSWIGIVLWHAFLMGPPKA